MMSEGYPLPQFPDFSKSELIIICLFWSVVVTIIGAIFIISAFRAKERDGTEVIEFLFGGFLIAIGTLMLVNIFLPDSQFYSIYDYLEAIIPEGGER